MNLTRPINFFDIESTGTDPLKDRIVTLAIVKVLPNGDDVSFSWKFNPGVIMRQEVIDIHGITNEEAATFDPFERHAKVVHEVLQGADIAGFGIHNFDVPILWEELNRAGVDWDVSKHHLVDCGTIYKKKEPRTLSAALKFYTGQEHTEAHNAMGDVNATMRVFDGQLKRYDDIPHDTIENLAKFSQMDDRIDLAGIIVRDKDGIPVYNTKRNRGVPVADDPGYAHWMLRSDFSQQTKRVITRILEEIASAGQQTMF